MGVDVGERKFSLGSQREADMRSRQDQLPHGETEAKEKSKPEQPAVRRAEDDAYLALKRVHTSFVEELEEGAFFLTTLCADSVAAVGQGHPRCLRCPCRVGTVRKVSGSRGQVRQHSGDSTPGEPTRVSSYASLARCTCDRLFHANDRILPLMKLLVTREVMYTLDPSTLFRQDSVATKLLSVYAKEVGMVYLQVPYSRSPHPQPLQQLTSIRSVCALRPACWAR